MVLLIASASAEARATPAQIRLAEISEMIHTASLFHDDVIDKATTRRGVPSVNQVYGNKLAILGGDFLLSRASISLARLRNLDVVELMSTIIDHLVKGEVMQMRPLQEKTRDKQNDNVNNQALTYYLRKNFYKTASLMAHSCLSAAVLGNYSDNKKRASYLYGAYVGQAFQLIDDVLDFEGTTTSIGKAPLADLKSGLATGPTLFACDEFPVLHSYIARKFEREGDIEETVSMVLRSQGLQKTRDLAKVHTEMAIKLIEDNFEPSLAKNASVSLAIKVIQRKN